MRIYNYIRDFFEPKDLEYEIRYSLAEVLNKFTDAFDNEVNESKTKGLSGQINGDEFNMGILPGDEMATFSAALKGKIIEKKRTVTLLEIYIMRDASTYLTFLLSIVASAIYLFMYFNNTKSLTPLCWSFGALIFGAFFSIWFSNNSVKTTQKQFEKFLKLNGLK